MENEKVKTSRASQTRTKAEAPKTWTPPSSLDAPPAPDGFRHRWIRAESMGFTDSKNIFGRLREGYELVRADEYSGTDYPVVADGKYAGVIGVGGLLLARIPEELAKQRVEYQKKLDLIHLITELIDLIEIHEITENMQLTKYLKYFNNYIL